MPFRLALSSKGRLGFLALLLLPTGCGIVGLDLQSDAASGLAGAGAGASDGGSLGGAAQAQSGGSSGNHSGGAVTATGGTLVPTGGTTATGGDAGTGSAGTGGGGTGGGGSGGGTGGSLASGGADPSGTGGATGGNGGTANDLASCGAPGPTYHTFATDPVVLGSPSVVGDWGIDVGNVDNTGTLGWTGIVGSLGLGALEMIIEKPSSGRQVLTPMTRLGGADLTDKVLVAHLLVESGRDAVAQVYAYSPGANTWTDGEPVLLTVGEWVCVELDLGDPTPYYREAGFDPTSVQTAGIQVARSGGSSATDSIVVYLDDFSY